jgi:hypothetical protein
MGDGLHPIPRSTGHSGGIRFLDYPGDLHIQETAL